MNSVKTAEWWRLFSWLRCCCIDPSFAHWLQWNMVLYCAHRSNVEIGWRVLEASQTIIPAESIIYNSFGSHFVDAFWSSRHFPLAHSKRTGLCFGAHASNTPRFERILWPRSNQWNISKTWRLLLCCTIIYNVWILLSTCSTDMFHVVFAFNLSKKWTIFLETQ